MPILLPFNAVGERNVRLDHQTLDTFIVAGGDHGDVRAAKDRADYRAAAGGAELQIAGDHRAQRPGRTAADNDRFGFNVIFLEEAFFFGDPHRRVGQTDRRETDADFVGGDKAWCLQSDN